MKFRISSKDLIIFLIFCLFLLYLCALGVNNFIEFGSTGSFPGLNPFPAFVGNKLSITLILFVIALIVIFASVSSYIFEHESKKGFGIDVRDKEEKGYSQWAKDKEIKEDKGVLKVNYQADKLEGAGIPLIYNKKKNEMWVDDGEYHTVVIGSSGSGKSQTVVKPLVNLLAKHGESMIITDPKGELYVSAAHHLKELGYNVVVLNFRDPLKGNAWNPLTLPYQYMKMGNMDKATELLDDVALNILYDPNNKGEPFWEKSAADFFSGLALGLFQDAKEEEININSINVMSTVGEERLGPSNYTKEYFTMKGEASPAYIFASNTVNAPTDTKGGIMSTFRQKIRLFASRENLSEMLGHSDFNMLDIGKQKTAVFIVIHDEKTTYHALATIFIKQCYETLIDVAQENGGKLPIRTNFILDEFANMPPLKDVDSMVTAARSRQMRFTFIIQNFAQLNDVYGKEVAEVIRGNCGNTLYLISSELAALEEISKMCGEVKSKEKDKTASTPLVTVTDLQKFKMGEALLIRTRKGPFKTKMLFDWQTNWGYERVDEEFPKRDSKPVQIFDIKAFVKAKKQEKAEKEGASSSPFGPNSGMFGGGMNPFGGDMNPFGGSINPFGPSSSSNPFAPKPEPISNQSSNIFGNNLDLDAMIRDIDKKIAELDAEENKAKAIEEKKNNDQLILNDSKVEIKESPMNVEKMTSKDINNVALKEMENNIVNNGNKIDSKVSSNVNDEYDDINDLISNIDKKLNTIDQNNMYKNYDKIENESLSMFNNTIIDSPKQINDDNIISEKEADVIEKEASIIEKKPEIIEKQENNYDSTQSKIIENKNEVLENNNNDKPIINVNIDNVELNKSIISDDEFFDDFFGDDDF